MIEKENEYEIDEFLGENKYSSDNDEKQNYAKKRAMLKTTKIVKQTWSIQEMFQKYKNHKLDLDPNYQRNLVWGMDKKVSFIESLFMGIIIPPIYVVEIPGENILDENKYEIVDGKQRVNTIIAFLQGKLKLPERYLEYYGDLFADKTFSEISNDEKYSQFTKTLLSSVLDFYVITANSPEFTKYDIFSRLNRGAAPLRVDEIRKAIYRSPVLEQIEKYVEANKNTDIYNKIFTKNDIKHYKDYGRFYRSIAFYLQTNIDDGCVLEYNSRPRDMINAVLKSIQSSKDKIITDEQVQKIIYLTISLKEKFYKNDKNDFLIDALIPFEMQDNIDSIDYDSILNDKTFHDSLKLSPGTTKNVDDRVKIVKKYVEYR